MRFACENCQTRYTLADEKIRGRILKIRCRTCSAIMVVRDPELPPVEAETASQPSDSAARGPSMPAEGGADETRQISAAAVQELLRAAGAHESSADDGGGEADLTRVVSVASVQALLKQSRDGEARGEEAHAAGLGAAVAADPNAGDAGAAPTAQLPAARTEGVLRGAAAGDKAFPLGEEPIDRAEELRRAITGGGFAEEWWAMAGSEQMGPMSRTRLLTLIDEGVLTPRSYVWRDGMGDWQRFGAVEDLVAGADPAVASWNPDRESAGSHSQSDSSEAWSEPSAPQAAETTPWSDTTEPGHPASDPGLSGWNRDDDTAEIDRSPMTPSETFPVASTHERILASIVEETTGPTLTVSRPAEAGQPAPSSSRTADGRGPWRTLRLVAAGTVLAASFAAGAYFFVPTGKGVEPAGVGPGVLPGGNGGRVVLADFELPDRSPLERNAVGEALAERVPGFSRCVETHPGGGRQRRIVMRAVVAPSGVVTSASVSSGDAGGELGSCLADRTRDIRFPGFAGEAVVISFPLLVVGNAP